MGKQLIICVETNSQSKSDYNYIKKTIEHFYDYDDTEIKLSPVYMSGRGNYSSPGIKKKIELNIKKYSVSSDKNENEVIYCFDCDNYTSNPADYNFLIEAKRYCADNGFKFVWFCKEIESVYLGRQIPDSQKKKASEQFVAKKKIYSLDKSLLYATRYLDKHSNLCIVLDECFSTRA